MAPVLSLIVSTTSTVCRASYGAKLDRSAAGMAAAARRRRLDQSRRRKSADVRKRVAGAVTASCSIAIGESRIRDWVVVLTGASYFESKRVSVESKTKCGRLFLTPGWFGLRISAPPRRAENEAAYIRRFYCFTYYILVSPAQTNQHKC